MNNNVVSYTTDSVEKAETYFNDVFAEMLIYLVKA